MVDGLKSMCRVWCMSIAVTMSMVSIDTLAMSWLSDIISRSFSCARKQNSVLRDAVYEFLAAIDNDDLRAMQALLVQNGDLINARDVKGHALLHVVAQRGSVAMVDCLLQHGADIHAQDSQMRTPLTVVVNDVQYCDAKHLQMVALLLAYGADANTVDYTGFTPLAFILWQLGLHEYASREHNACAVCAYSHERSVFLQDRCADMSHRPIGIAGDPRGDVVKNMITMLIDAGGDVAMCDKAGANISRLAPDAWWQFVREADTRVNDAMLASMEDQNWLPEKLCQMVVGDTECATVLASIIVDYASPFVDEKTDEKMRFKNKYRRQRLERIVAERCGLSAPAEQSGMCVVS